MYVYYIYISPILSVYLTYIYTHKLHMLLYYTLVLFTLWPRKLMWRHFVTFSMCSISLSMAIIIMGNDLISRSRNMYVVSWSTSRIFIRFFFRLFKLFTSRLTNISAPHFNSIEQHQCDQYVKEAFLENPMFDFSPFHMLSNALYKFFPTTK